VSIRPKGSIEFVGEFFEVRTQVDRDLTTVSRVDLRLGLIENLGVTILGAEPSDMGSVFVLLRRLQVHGSTVVGDALATQKTTSCPLIEGITVAM
jgi:hypothetical protein